MGASDEPFVEFKKIYSKGKTVLIISLFPKRVYLDYSLKSKPSYVEIVFNIGTETKRVNKLQETFWFVGQLSLVTINNCKKVKVTRCGQLKKVSP